MAYKERNALKTTLKRQGISINIKHVDKFSQFLQMYYEGCQYRGEYLTDVPLDSLVAECRRLIYKDAYELWRT